MAYFLLDSMERPWLIKFNGFSFHRAFSSCKANTGPSCSIATIFQWKRISSPIGIALRYGGVHYAIAKKKKNWSLKSLKFNILLVFSAEYSISKNVTYASNALHLGRKVWKVAKEAMKSAAFWPKVRKLTQNK